MAEPFLSEIRIFSFNFAPKGWALCNGQLLPINQNQALFSLLGTTYGGDGRVNFALPNLISKAPIHMGGQSSTPFLRTHNNARLKAVSYLIPRRKRWPAATCAGAVQALARTNIF